MLGTLALLLHAHLPFVRHPEHECSLEETWLFEAITESYLPLLGLLDGWHSDKLPVRITFSLSPTLCAMLRDPLLQERYELHLGRLIRLAEQEIVRARWNTALRPLAEHYHERFQHAQRAWQAWGGNLIRGFRRGQERGQVELITTAATHGLLPLLAQHRPSLRAQIRVAHDYHRACFGGAPRGFWLPECAYSSEIEGTVQAANLRWLVTDTHALLHARPRPRYGSYAPAFTPNGIAVFARDPESAKQVWSRHEGYPGDPRYRDFYRDLGYDADLDYVRPCLPAAPQRSFTGLKYHRITGPTSDKEVYDRAAAVALAAQHAAHFLNARTAQCTRLAKLMDRPPIIVAPYDAELFGHWWYEGPEFLDSLVRQVCAPSSPLALITPADYLRAHPTNPVVRPSPSSWGEGGYWGVWLSPSNSWVFLRLQKAQARMTALVNQFPQPDPLLARALRQAGRELLLAQASDWTFILHHQTSPDYARSRILAHLERFDALEAQLSRGRVDPAALAELEGRDNLFHDLDYRYWAGPSPPVGNAGS